MVPNKPSFGAPGIMVYTEDELTDSIYGVYTREQIRNIVSALYSSLPDSPEFLGIWVELETVLLQEYAFYALLSPRFLIEVCSWRHDLAVALFRDVTAYSSAVHVSGDRVLIVTPTTQVTLLIRHAVARVSKYLNDLEIDAKVAENLPRSEDDSGLGNSPDRSIT